MQHDLQTSLACSNNQREPVVRREKCNGEGERREKRRGGRRGERGGGEGGDERERRGEGGRRGEREEGGEGRGGREHTSLTKYSTLAFNSALLLNKE